MKKFEMGGTSFTADSNDPMIGGTMASSMAKGGGTKSAFDSTKARLKGKSQEYRINKLIEAVKKANWSSNPLTIDSGIVKVYSNMYDLEPTRVASIFNNYQKGNKMKKGGGVKKTTKYIVFYTSKETGGMREKVFENELEAKEFSNTVNGSVSPIKMAKGGGLKGKAKYVPNYMVQSVEVERKGKTTDIDGANILDGVYVKKGVKFAKGGGFDDEKLYYVVGKKKGQLVDVSTDNNGEITPMTKEDAIAFSKTMESNYDYNSLSILPYRGKNVRVKLAKNDKMEWGGTAESSETGAFIGGENASSMYKTGGGVFSSNALWHTPSNSYITIDNKTGIVKNVKDFSGKAKKEITIDGVLYRKNAVYGTYNSVIGNNILNKQIIEKNFKFENGGELNETFPDTDAMSYAKGGGVAKFTKESNRLMYFEPVNQRNVIAAYINDSSKIVSPTDPYYLPNPIAKEVIKWSKKNGYKFIQDDKEYANGGSTSTWSYSIGGL